MLSANAAYTTAPMPIKIPASVACRLAVETLRSRDSAIGLVMNLKPLSKTKQNTKENSKTGTAALGFGAAALDAAL